MGLPDMPFIIYPDVPNIPGIGLPQLPQPPVGYVFPTISVDLSSLDPSDTVALDNVPIWAITDIDGNTLLSPDSVIDFEYRGEMKIPTYPIEGGSFQSYNKIPVPYDIRMTVSCNGNGEQTRDEFLSACEALRESLDTAVITTPDAIYDSVNMVHFDYRREAHQGVSRLLVQAWFQEIRVDQTGQTQTAQPDGMDASQNGQLSPVNPSTSQSSAYNDTVIT
jgi:hypothetical protein